MESKIGNRISPTEVRNKVGQLMERRSWLTNGGEPPSPGYNPALAITREFESLSEQTGVSVAALEFLNNPVGLVGRGARNLTRGENALEDLNVEWANELKAAGLLE